MFRSYQRTTHARDRSRLRLLLTLLYLVVIANSAAAQQNVTLDDTDLFILYAPATSWHASTVECDTCLAPPSTLAHSGTWHDGTHIVPTTDEDDEGTVGDQDGDGKSTSASPQSTTSTSAPPPPPPPTASSVQPAQTNAAQDNDDDDHDGDDGDKGGGKGGGSGKDGDGKRRLRRFNRSVKSRWLTASSLETKRDGENPFEVQSSDSDDPGFQDVPVTASLNFTGTAIYIFAVLPLFPAPPNTTPTFTNLSFTLDGSPHGSFTFRPDPTATGTPTVNSSASDKFQSNVNVFSVAGLEDTAHSLIVNVGVDSVFLLDYVMYTAGASDPTIPGGSVTTDAPDSQRTAGSATNAEDCMSYDWPSIMCFPFWDYFRFEEVIWGRLNLGK
ncbi:uncharacterized protein FOMMEDRAFT_154211 [Fomitiporia mediterranea MF3/22]|uniref:uncharacterized protein n=1 Tax=Fomitiporia mediterranea (strain MF3/22) TaxID=694068 RepID=UPI0004407F42|nr:uncharacterized protein FOMMEDRAFT_154211 [Fomitiporia mediterranea MF3/22]EJD05044.1 hypothetical protein FOMMEDRAFT_154211 [Fomitiporia mediterranea MF3/22]